MLVYEDDTLDKIDRMYRVVVRNQNKVSIIEDRLNNSKKINQDKLIRVREMNEHN